MSDHFSAGELLDADATESAISALFAGRSTEFEAGADSPPGPLGELASAFRAPVPEALVERVAGLANTRRALPWMVRGAAVVLGVTFLANGLPSVISPAWVSHFAGLPPSPHVYREEGLAFLAVAVLMFASALRTRLMTAAVAIGCTLALAVASSGYEEIASIATREGGRLHLAELLAALLLLGTWIRYRWRLRHEEPG